MELELPELAPFAVRAEQAPYSLSGPGVELPFDAFSVIARGDVVWRVVDGGLERHVDDGVALQRTHVGPPSMFRGAMLAFAGDDVWVVDASLHRASPAIDGGILFSPPRSLRHVPHWLLGAPDEVLIGSAQRDVLIRGEAELIAPELTDGSRYDARTAWLDSRFGEPPSVVGVELAGGGTVVKGTLELSRTGRSDPFRGFTPLITVPTPTSTITAVPRLTPPTVKLELYESGPLFGPVISATDRYVIARSLDGTQLKVFERRLASRRSVEARAGSDRPSRAEHRCEDRLSRARLKVRTSRLQGHQMGAPCIWHCQVPPPRPMVTGPGEA